MEIEFDPAKSLANLGKHGIALDAAVEMNLATAYIVEDRRNDYGETRLLAYGQIRGRLHVLYYTMRGDVIRLIGLRKANSRERRRYEGA